MHAGAMDHASLLIVDDHPLFADGFTQMVLTPRPRWTVRIARSAREAVELFPGLAPNLAVIDVRLPDSDGCDVVRQLATLAPDVPYLLISGRDDPAMRVRARACGARGFIAETVEPAAIIDALGVVLAGGTAFDGVNAALPALTARQAEILVLLSEGHGNTDAAPSTT